MDSARIFKARLTLTFGRIIAYHWLLFLVGVSTKSVCLYFALFSNEVYFMDRTYASIKLLLQSKHNVIFYDYL
jgi:hypothetical protein